MGYRIFTFVNPDARDSRRELGVVVSPLPPFSLKMVIQEATRLETFSVTDEAFAVQWLSQMGLEFVDPQGGFMGIWCEDDRAMAVAIVANILLERTEK